MSAITAAKAGSKVVVLEKAGNLAAVNGVKVSGPFAVNTPVLRERGTILTVNEVFQHVMNYTHWEPNSALIRNYLEHSSEVVENLLEIGYQFKEANFRFKTPFVDEKGGFHLILTDVDKRVRLWTEAYEKYFGYCGCEYGGTSPKASRPATQDKYDQNLAAFTVIC